MCSQTLVRIVFTVAFQWREIIPTFSQWIEVHWGKQKESEWVLSINVFLHKFYRIRHNSLKSGTCITLKRKDLKSGTSDYVFFGEILFDKVILIWDELESMNKMKEKAASWNKYRCILVYVLLVCVWEHKVWEAVLPCALLSLIICL